ncbi:3081_t:CDS:2, partial [Paraglomus occultum]
NEHPSTANLTTYSEDVDDYIHRLARSRTSSSSQPTLAEKTKTFVGYLFNQKSSSLGSYSPKSDTQSDERAESEYLEADQDNNRDGNDTITTTPPLTPGHSALGYNLVEATHSAQQLYTATISTPQPESSTPNKKNKGKQKQEIPEILVVADIDPEPVTPIKKVQKPKEAKPPSWLAQLEGAMLANGIAADNHARRLGIASYHMGPFQSWLANHQPAIVQWDNANANALGFKQHFIANFFNNETKEEALTIAERRIQKPGESIDMYIAALRKIWQECDPNEMTDYHKLKNFL